MADRYVAVKLSADTTRYTKAIDAAERRTRELARSQEKAQRASERWKAIGMASQIGGVALAAGLLAATKAASNQEQAVGALTATFKVNSAQMLENAKSASEIGLSTTQYANAAAKLGGQLSNLGVDQVELAATTDDLIRKASDLAAQYGGTTAEAVDALGAAMRGEADPAEFYSLQLNATAVNAEMLATGADKATAILTLLNKQMEKSGAAGAMAREYNTTAAATERARAEFDDAAAILGTALLPAMTKAANAVGGLLDIFNKLPQPAQEAATYIAAFGVVAGIAGPKIVGAAKAITDLAVAVGAAGKAGPLLTALFGSAAVAGTIGATIPVVAAQEAAIDNLSTSMQAATGWNEHLVAGLTSLGRDGGPPATMAMNGLRGALMSLVGVKQDSITAWARDLMGLDDEMKTYIDRVNAGEANSKTFMASIEAGMPVAEAFANAQKTMGTSIGDAAGAIDHSAQASIADADAKENEAAAIDKAAEAFLNYLEAVQRGTGLIAARDALIGQTERLTKAAKENGLALWAQTEAGKANRAAFDAEAKSVAALAQATYEEVKAKNKSLGPAEAERRALEAANRVRKSATRELLDNAEAAGFNRKQVKALLDKMNLIAPIKTGVELEGVAKADQQLKGIIRSLDAIIRKSGLAQFGIGRQPRAAGGYITGPGTGTSDSIPANLSNGEYVLRASAVKRIGVDELDRMNYAKGGRVGRRKPSGGGRTPARGGGSGPGRAHAGGDGSDMGFGQAVKAIERWQDKVEKSKQKLADLKKEAADYANSISQNILSSAGGGLFDMFKKSDMAANAAKLAEAQDRVATASRRLYDAQVKVNTAAPEERAAALAELADAQRDLADATGEQAKAEADAAASAPTPTNIMGRMRGRAAAIENYASKVKALMGRGLSIELIKELAGADMLEAGPVLDALLAMPADALAELGSLDKRAKDAAASVGSAVSGAAYAPQIGAAEMELGVNEDGLKDALKDADKTVDKEWRKKLAKMGLSVEERVQMMQSIRQNDGKLTKHWRNILAKAGLSAEERAELMVALTGADTTMGREWRDKLQKTGLSAEEKAELAAELGNAKNPGRALRKYWIDELQNTGLSAVESSDLFKEITNTKDPSRSLYKEWVGQLMATGLTAKEAKEMIGDIQTTHGVVDEKWTNADRKKIGLGARDGGIGGDVDTHGYGNTKLVGWQGDKKHIGLGAANRGVGEEVTSEGYGNPKLGEWEKDNRKTGLGAKNKSIGEDVGTEGYDNARLKQWSNDTIKVGLGAKAAVQSVRQAIYDVALEAWRVAKANWHPPLKVPKKPNPSDYGLAMGGLVRGPGSMTSDSVPAMLSNGEFVIRAAAVSKYGADLMHAINAGRFASGGPVGYRTTTTANPTAGSGGSAVVTSVPVIVQIDGREIAKSQLKIQRQSGGTITVGG